MEKPNYNPYDPDSVKRYTLEEISAMEKGDQEKMMFEIPLELGDSDASGEREVKKWVTYIDGKILLNGKQVRSAEACAAIKDAGKEHLLNEKRKKALGMDEFSDKRKTA